MRLLNVAVAACLGGVGSTHAAPDIVRSAPVSEEERGVAEMLASDIRKYGSEEVKVQDTIPSDFWPSAKRLEEFLDERIVDHKLHEGMRKEQITSILDYWKKHVNFINTHHVDSKTTLF